MSSFIHDSAKWSQGLKELATEHAQIQSDLSRCRCPKCDHFGVVLDTHDYYGIIYRCNCLPVFWVINPETGKQIEEVGA